MSSSGGSPSKKGTTSVDMQIFATNGNTIVDESYDPHLHRNRPHPTT